MNVITINELAEMVGADRPQRANQLRRARIALGEHPDAVLLECADEWTGVRFRCPSHRRYQCVKLGSCRQPLYYQLWASWSSKDIAKYGKGERQ